MRVRTYNDLVRDMDAWSNAMNRFFSQGMNPYDYANNGGRAMQNNGQWQTSEPRQGATLPLDIWATPEAFHVAAYVPGVNPDDVEITFEEDELTIRGQLPEPAEAAQFVQRELYRGTFERRLNFNVRIDVDNIEAHFTNGLLTLMLPKSEAARPKQIKVQAQQASQPAVS